MDDALLRSIEDNLLSRIDKLEAQVASLQGRELQTSALSNISDNLGDIRAGRFLAMSAGNEPTDADGCGVFMSAQGETFGSDTYHIGGSYNGAIQAGLNAATGKFIAGAGKVVLDANGEYLVCADGYSDNTSYKFSNGTNFFAWLYGRQNASYLYAKLKVASLTNENTQIELNSEVVKASGKTGTILLNASDNNGGSVSDRAWLSINASNGEGWINSVGHLGLGIYKADLVTDHSYSGTRILLTANEDQNFGDVCYINSDGEAQLGDADAIATSNCVVMLGAVNVTGTNADYYCLPGSILRDDTWNWTVGGKIYLTVTGTTGNTLSQTAPTGTDDVIQILGVALTADIMLFQPQLTQVEHV